MEREVDMESETIRMIGLVLAAIFVLAVLVELFWMRRNREPRKMVAIVCGVLAVIFFIGALEGSIGIARIVANARIAIADMVKPGNTIQLASTEESIEKIKRSPASLSVPSSVVQGQLNSSPLAGGGKRSSSPDRTYKTTEFLSQQLDELTVEEELLSKATKPPKSLSQQLDKLMVEKELQESEKCPKYQSSEYPYDRRKLLPSLKTEMEEKLYAPYTRREFSQDSDVHVEHIVSKKQAHYSGLCLKDAKIKKRFASDLLNLTLAGRGVNQAKSSCDAKTWVPPENSCWFAARVIKVRSKYGLSIDQEEKEALKGVLSACSNDELSLNRNIQEVIEPLRKWDKDGNGQISCAELRENGIKTPIEVDHEAYLFMRDGNCDGTVVCNN